MIKKNTSVRTPAWMRVLLDSGYWRHRSCQTSDTGSVWTMWYWAVQSFGPHSASISLPRSTIVLQKQIQLTTKRWEDNGCGCVSETQFGMCMPVWESTWSTYHRQQWLVSRELGPSAPPPPGMCLPCMWTSRLPSRRSKTTGATPSPAHRLRALCALSSSAECL